MVPEGVPLTATGSMIPHLAERERVYQFPLVYDAEWVLVDTETRRPQDRIGAGVDDCEEALPPMGFVRVAEEEGVELWEREGERLFPPGLPESCAARKLS